MQRERRIAGLLLGLLALASAGPVAAERPSDCEQLAAEARSLPDSAWAASREPLAPWLRIDTRPAGPPPSALQGELAQDRELRAALYALDSGVVGVDRLAGSDVYRVSTIQGTANCQSSVFVEARPGRPWRKIAEPGAEVPCGSHSGFGRVFARPAFVVKAIDRITLGERYTVVPWTGRGWAPACTLALSFRRALSVAGQFCRDEASSLCKAGRAMATEIAAAYETDRHGGAPLEPLSFASPGQPSAEVLAALDRADPRSPPDFPIFGLDPRQRDVFRTNYANVELRHLALWLDGRWWLAVVGRGGVGWREGTTTLLTIFEARDGGLLPMAGYQVDVDRAGLNEAAVAR
ncbi:hypothetical protein [Roseateles violae]|uniref:Uncharacterized protein n=1 Tax=Roseateles violae TaxID=3058042 RepID=A0ABT8DTT2_9BURK|nr:hypothetical protein [Pelomonas sp. PFR6]MDN3921700.1 hypothetical protein [Pelomonas sp. PFR6]